MALLSEKPRFVLSWWSPFGDLYGITRGVGKDLQRSAQSRTCTGGEPTNNSAHVFIINLSILFSDARASTPPIPTAVPILQPAGGAYGYTAFVRLVLQLEIKGW
jgi:hypothetical protein